MSDGSIASAAYSELEHSHRIAAVRSLMSEHDRDLDALIVTSPENIYYLSGLNHQGYFAFTMLFLPREGEPFLLTRRMEAYTVSRQTPHIDHVGYGDEEDEGKVAVNALKSRWLSSGRVGFDRSSMFMPTGVWEELRQGLPNVKWVDTSRSPSNPARYRAGLVDEVRLVKSQAEIDQIRRAATISDRAMSAGIRAAAVGVNEMEIAAAVYREMILGGGEYPGFVPLIRSAETLMEEHSTWRDRSLERGDRLFMELSGASARYHAPLTRMGYVSQAAPGAQVAMELALSAFSAVVDALRPGVVTGTVYDAWQEVVDRGLGHERHVRHHCGYSVGIGFPPSWVGSSSVLGIRRNGHVEVKAGMVFHVLSWITDEKVGEHFVSDTVVVGERGAEVVTTTPHQLLLD